MATLLEARNFTADPARVRTLAASLLAMHDADWSDWELDFLDNMAAWRGRADLTERQREKLLELIDDSRDRAAIEGLSVARLIQQCWQARIDLPDELSEFVEHIHAAGHATLKGRRLRRLLHCARRLQLIESYVGTG